ncbi:MAG: 30S ribosome-binding factor RbfA [Eubacterium sp.]|nr:30S ribosome-binding factor RbfA [Eubacterium sp.]
MRKNSVKNTRINEAVRQELSILISREIKDPRVDLMTSVTKVFVAPDLKTCKVYISVYGDADKKEATMAGLKSSEGFLRRMLAAKLNLRHTPELTFILDESIEYGMYMSRRIAELGISSDDDDDETGEKTEEAGTLPENDED